MNAQYEKKFPQLFMEIPDPYKSLVHSSLLLHVGCVRAVYLTITIGHSKQARDLYRLR